MNRKHANPSVRLNPLFQHTQSGEKEKEWTEKKKAPSCSAVLGRNYKPRPEALPATHTHTITGGRRGGRRGATRFTDLAHIFVVVVATASLSIVSYFPVLLLGFISPFPTFQLLLFPLHGTKYERKNNFLCCHPQIFFCSIFADRRNEYRKSE